MNEIHIAPKPTFPGTSSMDAPGLVAAILHYYRIFRRGWWLITISIATCLVLSGAYLARTSPLYAATARVLVLQWGGRALSIAKDDSIQPQDASETFLPTQMAILQSPRVVERAIESIGPRNLPTLRAARGSGGIPELAQLAIKDYLKVSRPDRTALIVSIEYRAGSAEEATRMASAIVSSYERFLEDHMQSTNSEVVSLIARARDELSRNLETAQAKYLEFQRGHPQLLDDEAGRSLINSRLIELDRAANESLVKAMRLRSQIESGRKLSREGMETWAIAYAISQIGADPGSNLIPRPWDSQGGALDYVRQLGREQQELAARFGPDYSKVKDLQEQVSKLRGEKGEATGHADERETQQLLASLERSLESIEAMRAEIARQARSELAEAQKMAGDLSTGRNLRDNLDRLKMLFNTAVDQLKQAQLGGDFSRIHSRTIEPANASNKPVRPRTLLTLAMALVAGSVVGMGAALVADGLDDRIRSLNDLQASLGLRVLGVVPRLPEEQSMAIGGAGMICQSRPQSLSAEAYKVIRTNLELLRRDRHLQVILVRSAVRCEGRSTTSSNLAISQAQAGRRVLLVDADLRRPSLHRVFGLGRDRGLVHILKGLLPLDMVAQRTSIEGLDFVAAGPDISNHSELLMSPAMKRFIDDIHQSYDIAIIDSPPLLSVTDATIVGSLADGIVLVAGASVIRRPEAARVVSLLHAVEAPVLGAIINGLEPGRVAPGERVSQHFGPGAVLGLPSFDNSNGSVPTVPRPAQG